MRAHHVLLLSLCLLAAAYAVLLFVSPAAAPIGVTLTVVGLVLVSTRYAWRAKFLALFNEASKWGRVCYGHFRVGGAVFSTTAYRLGVYFDNMIRRCASADMCGQ